VRAARAGGVVGFGPFKFGGSWEHVWGEVGNANAVSQCVGAFTCQHDVWDAGATYTIGPFSVGLAGTWGRFQHPYALAAISQASNNMYALTAHYAIGPGISLEAAVTHTDYGSGIQSSGFTVFNGAAAGTGVAGTNAPFGVERDYHDTALMIGSRFNF